MRWQVLGEDHPDTIDSAWNLLLMLIKLEGHAAANELWQRHLLSLLEVDPAKLRDDLKFIREGIDEYVNSSLIQWENTTPAKPAICPSPHD